jgi:hypothetical protein
MKLTAEELKELELIKDFTGYNYVIEPLPEPLTVGVETHRIAVYKTVNGANTYRPIITATDDEELVSRTKAVLANMTARYGEIMTCLLNKNVGGDEFYVTYWPEIGVKDNPEVWYNLRRGDKTISTMLDRETLSTLTHALERVLA